MILGRATRHVMQGGCYFYNLTEYWQSKETYICLEVRLHPSHQLASKGPKLIADFNELFSIGCFDCFEANPTSDLILMLSHRLSAPEQQNYDAL